MSQFVDVKTAELIGPALNWAVAQACKIEVIANQCWGPLRTPGLEPFKPSDGWMDGGPLWDEWAISMEHYDGWLVAVVGGDAQGPTKLVALCRAIVSAKLGDVVQVPAELVGGEA